MITNITNFKHMKKGPKINKFLFNLETNIQKKTNKMYYMQIYYNVIFKINT